MQSAPHIVAKRRGRERAEIAPMLGLTSFLCTRPDLGGTNFFFSQFPFFQRKYDEAGIRSFEKVSLG